MKINPYCLQCKVSPVSSDDFSDVKVAHKFARRREQMVK